MKKIRGNLGGRIDPLLPFSLSFFYRLFVVNSPDILSIQLLETLALVFFFLSQFSIYLSAIRTSYI